TSAPVTPSDEVITKYVKAGIPRALVFHRPPECLNAVEGLIQEEGNPESKHYELLWVVLGKAKADVIRTAVAKGPYAEKDETQVAMANLFTSGASKPSPEMVQRYKEKMTRKAGESFERYVGEFDQQREKNKTNFPETAKSCEKIGELAPE